MTIFTRNEDVAYRILGEEAVLLNPEDNQIHLLNEVAAFTWELLVKPQTTETIVDAICEEFDVPPEAAESDFQKFSVELLQKGLMTASDGTLV